MQLMAVNKLDGTPIQKKKRIDGLAPLFIIAESLIDHASQSNLSKICFFRPFSLMALQFQ